MAAKLVSPSSAVLVIPDLDAPGIVMVAIPELTVIEEIPEPLKSRKVIPVPTVPPAVPIPPNAPTTFVRLRPSP